MHRTTSVIRSPTSTCIRAYLSIGANMGSDGFQLICEAQRTHFVRFVNDHEHYAKQIHL